MACAPARRQASRSQAQAAHPGPAATGCCPQAGRWPFQPANPTRYTQTRAALTRTYDPSLVSSILEDAAKAGDAAHGAELFASPKLACLSCHQAAGQGGNVGPDLSSAGLCLKPQELVESLLWPKRQVKEGFTALTVATTDGKTRQGYKLRELGDRLEFRDPTSGNRFEIARSDIEDLRTDGTLMPDGLAESMSATDRRDLVRFLLDLGRPTGNSAGMLMRHSPARRRVQLRSRSARQRAVAVLEAAGQP